MVGCTTENTVAVIDPQIDIELYMKTAERHKLSIDIVIDTHTHADHQSGARKLAKLTGAKLFMHKNSEVNGVDQKLVDSNKFYIGNRHFQVISTPGHTSDGITLYVDDWYLLTGDTLFVGDVGRVDLALGRLEEGVVEANAAKLYGSIQKLLRLPEWTEVYPGHFAGSACGKGMSGKMISTLGRERKKNSALSMAKAEFIKYVTSNQPDMPNDYKKTKLANVGED
ncbi:MBL fold metallo-hydrolase [Candidatus Saccharibacteria bacterium]|nr:MBL fold metallo-hydrolase [Candidatus Saccharibacteria bacterium]